MKTFLNPKSMKFTVLCANVYYYNDDNNTNNNNNDKQNVKWSSILVRKLTKINLSSSVTYLHVSNKLEEDIFRYISIGWIGTGWITACSTKFLQSLKNKNHGCHQIKK